MHAAAVAWCAGCVRENVRCRGDGVGTTGAPSTESLAVVLPVPIIRLLAKEKYTLDFKDIFLERFGCHPIFCHDKTIISESHKKEECRGPA